MKVLARLAIVRESFTRIQMIGPDHKCWWTAHHTTRLTRRVRSLTGAGICLQALEFAATLRNAPFATAASSTDEFGLIVTIASERGALHDGCMISFENASPDLVAALVGGMLEHHAAYLRCERPPRALYDHICRRLVVDSTVRGTSRPRHQTVVVKDYPVRSSWLGRWTTAPTVFRSQ